MNITNEIATIIVIAVIVAVVTEIIKVTPLSKHMNDKLTNLLTLALGLVCGLCAMYIVGGQFAEYITIGLAGAVMSSGVYEYVNNLFVDVLKQDIGDE